jgi:DNA-binding NtrC family response regulator
VEIIQKSSQNDCPVIIYGESGTGKELVAQAIHSAGTRKDGPFVQLNCGALNESMLEIELFGHIRGAFAAAGRHRTGSFEAADGGDIFLDDIADVSLSIQNKLLRLLENRQFERLGDHRPVTADVRIISATSRNLKRQIQQGLFREDLFFRINVIPIHLPPLRERKEDIPLLVSTFMKPLRLHTGKQISRLAPAAMAKLMDHAWPGNVRELKSTLQYAFVVAEHDHILPEHLPPTISGNSRQCPPVSIFEPPGSEAMETTEKESLIEALRRTGGNQSKAARLLSVSRVTVWNRMKKYGIDLKKILVM